MNAHAPPYEPYRVILDYEALQDGFLDRIDDLGTTLEQIEMAGEMAKGQLQKCLTKNPGKAIARKRDHRSASNRRMFGWESLGKTLKGTGLVLILALDDQRFAPIREQLSPRKRPLRKAALSMVQEGVETRELTAELLKDHMKKLGQKGGKMGGSKGGKRRAKLMSARARQRAAFHAARMRWKKPKLPATPV